MLSRPLTIAAAAFVALGLALRAIQYVVRPSLWHDEAMLGVSIVHRPLTGLLLSPLEYNQIAPPGFLEIVKLSTMLLGSSDLAVRLPSFVCAIAALFAFAFLARKVLQREAIVVAICVFALAPMLLIYAAEVKQYSGDLLAVLLLTLAVLNARKSNFERRWVNATAVAALVAVWFSDASVLVLTGLAVGLVVLAVLERDRTAGKAALTIGPAWAFAIVAHQIGAQIRITAETRGVMHRYWETAFMPFPPTTLEAAVWLPRAFILLYTDALGLRSIHGVVLVVALGGMIALWRSGRRDIVLLLSGPVVIAVIASAFRFYPLSGRLSIFALPALTILFAAGTGALATHAGKWAPVLAALMLVVMVKPPEHVLRGQPPSWMREDIQPAVARIRRERQADDRIYVYSGAVPIMEYYATRGGLAPTEWDPGRNLRLRPDEYTGDLARFSGARRLWLLFAHSDSAQRAPVLAAADKIGTRVMTDTANDPRAATARAPLFLYELVAQQPPSQ